MIRIIKDGTYLSNFFNPIQNLADQVNNIQRAFTASERLINLLDVKPEVLDSQDALEIEHFEGLIEFKNVLSMSIIKKIYDEYSSIDKLKEKLMQKAEEFLRLFLIINHLKQYLRSFLFL